MASDDLMLRGEQLNIIHVDSANDRVTYRLGKEKEYRWSDPEEQVRAQMILDLIFNYQYSPSRMETEVLVPARTPDIFADVVVFADDRRREPYITVELKPPSVGDAERTRSIEQLFGYANSLRSPYAMYYDATVRKCYDVLQYGGLERDRNLIPDIPHNYGNIPVYMYIKAGATDLGVIGSNELSRVFERCHRELWGGGMRDPTAAFDEMSKLVFAKLYDEQRTRNGEAYLFQWGNNETDVMVAQRVVDRFDEARSRDPRVFADEIRVEPRKIANVVRLLQRVCLMRTDLDAKGRAFEQFLGEVFRGRLGQYFTRREIVDFLVAMLRPELGDVVLDPACGSGGFLVYCMKRVFEQIERDYSGDQRTVIGLKSQFALNNVFGIEINERIARVAKMDMVINEDGHTNIENHTAFDNIFPNSNIRDGRFTLILTNPPFGDYVKAEDRDKLGRADLVDFVLSRGGKSTKSEVLFIERCTRFLGSGRLGMVVPDGILSNPSDKRVRQFILDNYRILAIVGLPAFAFRKAGSGMRTSLLIARKWDAHESRGSDYEIFMAIADHIGYDSTARPDRSDLPQLLGHYENESGGLDDKVVRVRRSAVSGDLRLDPLYYYLGPLIEQAFSSIPHPIHSLREIAGDSIQSGKSPSGGATYSTGTVPILLVGNLLPDGQLNLDDLNYVEQGFYDANEGRGAIQPLNILIAKDGATTGKVGIVPAEFDMDQCLINEHLFRLTIPAVLPGDPEPGSTEELEDWRMVNVYYLFFFLRSWLGQSQIQREVSGGAQGGITRPFVENIRVPVPPIEERKAFVAMAMEQRGKYLDLLASARAEQSNLEGLIAATIRGWSDQSLGATDEHSDQAVR